MWRMLRLEWRHCLQRKECQFVFAFLLLLSLGSFLLTCFHFYGHSLSFVRSAYEMTLIQGTYSHVLLSVECMLLPLLASMIYADSYYSDCQSGVDKSIVTRTSRTTYLLAKAIVNTTVTFGVFFLPFLFNLVLCLIAFPLKGYDNNFSLPPYDIGVQNYHPDILFDLIRVQSPLLYNMLYMTLISLVAALVSLLAYGLYFFSEKKFVTLTGVFLAFLLIEFALSFADARIYSLIEYLMPFGSGSLTILVAWLVLLWVSSIAMIVGKGLRHV